jgi:hypothetical protein
MALNKEIWVNDIREFLLPDNTFVTKGTDYSAFADNHQIHIPLGTSFVETEKDRTQFPASVSALNESEDVITMHHFTTNPVRIFNPEDVELSFDKRSVITKRLAESINQSIALEVVNTISAISGHSVPPDDNVLELMREIALEFDHACVPESGRYVMMNATAYSKLLKNLTDVQTNAFLACADLKSGVIGNIYGLNVMKNFYVTGAQQNNISVDIIYWHKDDYYFALSDVEIYSQENAPEYYGPVISASVRFGAFYTTSLSRYNNSDPGNGGN